VGAPDRLADDRLDVRLAECVVLSQATPERMAASAAEEPAGEALVGRLLSGAGRRRRMAVAEPRADAPDAH